MKLKSYAKINLSLRILKKLKNGFHDIESNISQISLHDEITIRKNNSERDIFIVKGKFKKHVNSNINSISETFFMLRKLGYLKNFYNVELNKNIPVFSGLGGGTGNSISIVNYFLKKKITKNIIKKFEKIAGTDFRVFLYKQTFQKNLYKVIKKKKNFTFHIVLIYPNIICKTKKIYSSVKLFNKPSNENYEKIKIKKKFVEAISKDKNFLQGIVEKKFPKIKEILSFITLQKDCIFSRMTGSGSVCYGLFKTRKSAKAAIIKVKKRFPKYWCVISKTI